MKDTQINVWQESMTPAQLKALRRKLAKRANQRLVRMERAESKVTGEKYGAIGAVEQAYDYLKNQAEGRTRFRESLNAFDDYNTLRREVTVLQGFLESKTSLVSGIREIEAKRLHTFESGNWGNKYTGPHREIKFASTKEFYDFFSSSTFADLKKAGFTSEQIVEAYDETRERYKGSDKEALDALEDALEVWREKGKATIKDLDAVKHGKPLKRRK